MLGCVMLVCVPFEVPVVVAAFPPGAPAVFSYGAFAFPPMPPPPPPPPHEHANNMTIPSNKTTEYLIFIKNLRADIMLMSIFKKDYRKF